MSKPLNRLFKPPVNPDERSLVEGFVDFGHVQSFCEDK